MLSFVADHPYLPVCRSFNYAMGNQCGVGFAKRGAGPSNAHASGSRADRRRVSVCWSITNIAIDRSIGAVRYRTQSEYPKQGPFHQELNLYIHELMVQISQTAGCNISNPLEARLARWLLMSRDRIGRDRFYLTQKLLSSMLGALREAVTGAAGRLQQRKLISYSRREITVLRGAALEATACSCYQLLKRTRHR